MARPEHGYRTKAGDKIPSVTTIIGARTNPGGMMWWANRLAFEPLMQARALLAQQADGEDVDKKVAKFLAQDIDLFDHNKASQMAASAGTLAHKMVELHLKGQKKVTAPLAGQPAKVKRNAEQAFESFLAWQRQTKLKVLETEVSLVSERFKFGGTLDANVVSINDQLSLADWKTANALYSDHLIQVGAYGLLWAENRPKKRAKGGYHVLRVPKEGGDFHHHYFKELSDAQEAFLLLRELYDLDKKLAKRVK